MNPTDPMSQFKERYQQYVETKSPQTPPVINSSGGKGFFNKFYVQGLIVGVVIIASGVLVYLNFKPTEQNNTAVKPTPQPIAKAPTPTPIQVSEDQITLELLRTWGSYYSKMKDDPKQIEDAKKRIMKRVLVFAGASKNNIELSSVASENPIIQEQKAEEKLKLKVLSWRNIDYAYVFIDASVTKYKDFPEKAKSSYELIKKYLTDGKTMEEAYNLAKEDPNFFKSITLATDKTFFKDGWDKDISEVLFKYKTGENTELISPPGGVYILAHINEANDTEFATMDDWMKSQN